MGRSDKQQGGLKVDKKRYREGFCFATVAAFTTLLSGAGVEQNFKKALEYYLKTVSLGDPAAETDDERV